MADRDQPAALVRQQTGTERSQARVGQVGEKFAREIMGAPP